MKYNKTLVLSSLHIREDIHLPENSVFCFRSSKTSGFSLLFCLPIFDYSLITGRIVNAQNRTTFSKVYRGP